MSISKTTTIDLITKSNGNIYVLIIVADEPWVDENNFRYRLQEKLNNYASYFLDGQMRKDYSDCRQTRITVRISSSSPIPTDLQSFISDMANALYTYGIDIETETVND